MKEQRNISLQGRSLAFSHTVGRAYGERRKKPKRGGNSEIATSRSSDNCHFCRSGMDASGIQVSFDLYRIVGIGIDVLIGSRGESSNHFLAINVRLGIGLDAGLSAGPFFAFYNHGANTPHDYSPLRMVGWNSSLGGGLGLSDYLSMSIIPANKWSNEKYHHWTTNSTLIGADGGGNISVGYTFLPFTW